jgi:hypothetical protein
VLEVHAELVELVLPPRTVGSVMLIVTTEVHPLASVTVTV